MGREEMRLDRFLCERKLGTRSQVKGYIRQGLVTVGGIVAKTPDLKIDPLSAEVTFQGELLKYRRYSYYMLNKPAGVVSATADTTADTVVSLLKDVPVRNLFPVGRLDKDVTGLLLLTNDGELAHRLLAPGRHVDKTYQVTLEHPLSQGDILRLEQGVDIGEKKPTLPARISVIDNDTVLLTIHEGKYHQVKRMLLAVGNGVRKLKRVSFGGLQLDQNLEEGAYRELTREEIERLRGKGDPSWQDPGKQERKEDETRNVAGDRRGYL